MRRQTKSRLATQRQAMRRLGTPETSETKTNNIWESPETSQA